ncbi:MAG: hypothetical protein WA936_05980, partial [Erythrobacter sp.]
HPAPGKSADAPILRDNGIALAALVLNVLYLRETRGRTTCLRNLSALIGTSEGTALRLTSLLGRETLVRVDENLSDRMDAKVRLEPALRERMDCMAGPDQPDCAS